MMVRIETLSNPVMGCSEGSRNSSGTPCAMVFLVAFSTAVEVVKVLNLER